MAHCAAAKVPNPSGFIGYLKQAYLGALGLVWFGLQAERFDLNSRPLAESLSGYFAGVLPNGLELQNAYQTEADGRGMPQRIGTFTLSFEKVFSALLALNPDRQSDFLWAAETTLQTLLAGIEERTGFARVGSAGQGGHQRGEAAFLYGAEFASQNGDPQFHFHVAYMNALFCPEDGKARSMDTRFLFNHMGWAGELATVELAKNLQAVGVDAYVTPERRLRIDAIPNALCEQWSSRTREVHAFMEANGLTTPSSWATKMSRTQAKADSPLEELYPRWAKEATEGGHDVEAIRRECFSLVREQSRDLSPDPELAGKALAFILSQERRPEEEPEDTPELSREFEAAASRIRSLGDSPTERDLERELFKEAPRFGWGLDQVATAAREFLASLARTRDELLLALRNAEHAEASELRRETAARVGELYDALFERSGESATERSLRSAIAGHDLSPAARAALRDVTGEGSAVRFLESPVAMERHGLLDAVRESMEDSGKRVLGLVLKNDDLDALQRGTDLQAVTLAKARYAWEKQDFTHLKTSHTQDVLSWAFGFRSKKELGWRDAQRDWAALDLSNGPHVLLVENAEKLPPPRLEELLSAAEEGRATVILAGDPERNPVLRELAKDSDFTSTVLDRGRDADVEELFLKRREAEEERIQHETRNPFSLSSQPPGMNR